MLATFSVTPPRRRTAAVPPRTLRVCVLALATMLLATIAGSMLLDRALDAARIVPTAGGTLERQAQLGRIAIQGLICALIIIGAAIAQTLAVVAPLRRRCAELTVRIADLQRTATIDPLTGTLNSDSFHARGTVEIAKARRHNRPLSLLVIDPDHFVEMRALHGADAGDRLLRAVAETVCGGTRNTDLIGRAASGAFAVLLPETDPAGAQLLAERLRERIETLSVPLATAAVSCTVSIGVAAAEKNASFFAPIVSRAAEALYEAQMRGRNRVFVNAA